MGGTEGRTVGECGQCGLLEGSAGLVLPRAAACHFALSGKLVSFEGCPNFFDFTKMLKDVFLFPKRSLRRETDDMDVCAVTSNLSAPPA